MIHLYEIFVLVNFSLLSVVILFIFHIFIFSPFLMKLTILDTLSIGFGSLTRSASVTTPSLYFITE